MSSARSIPEGGVPTVFHTRAGIAKAARILAQGSGPIAIDTERASSFRYDDRAFLIQLRRADTPIILIAPEGVREAVRECLAPVINGLEWVVHASATDLTSLAWLGLYPGALFDTEIAGRLLGIQNPNLAFVTEEFLGITLDKGYGATDWSRFPLSKAQLAYAALDVESLLELADEMSYELEQDHKTRWALEEFRVIREQFADITAPAPRHWHQSRSLRGLSDPMSLAVAKAVWEEREYQAQKTDVAPGQIISNAALTDIAKQIPRSINQLRRIPQMRRRSAVELNAWAHIIRTAADSDPRTWPVLPENHHDFPNKQFLKHNNPELLELTNMARERRDELAEEIAVVSDSLVSVSTLRNTVWAIHGDSANPHFGDHAQIVSTTFELREFWQTQGLRNWQIQQLQPVLAPRLL